MASSTDWARTIGTTLVLHLKEEELATFRKYKVFALLEGSGRVAMNQGGRGFDWEVRYRNQPVTSNTGESARVFARHNLWQRANLPYRGYSVTDMVTKREMLENRGSFQGIEHPFPCGPAHCLERLEQGVVRAISFQPGNLRVTEPSSQGHALRPAWRVFPDQKHIIC